MPQKQKAKSQIRDYYQDAVKKCKKCGMEYKGYRRDHNKKFHGKNLEPADSEACNMCKATVRSAQLQRHQLLRHAEYTCDLCGDTFVGRNKLNLHVVLHLEKQFICNACQKVRRGPRAQLYTSQMFLTILYSNIIGKMPFAIICEPTLRNMFVSTVGNNL